MRYLFDPSVDTALMSLHVTIVLRTDLDEILGELPDLRPTFKMVVLLVSIVLCIVHGGSLTMHNFNKDRPDLSFKGICCFMSDWPT